VGIPAKLNACSEGSRTARVTRADATKVLEYNDRLLSGTPIGRIVGGEAMKFGWQRLNAEYAKQFGIEAARWPPKAAQNS
jgi:hypothetical protein